MFKKLAIIKKFPYLGVVAGVASMLLYRLDIYFGKKSLEVISPLLLTFISTLVTALLITIFLKSKHKFNKIFEIPRKNTIFIAISSILSGIVGPLLFLYGLKYTSGVNASIFVNLNYLFMSVLAVYYLKEKKSISLFIGIFIALFGVFFLGTKGLSQTFSLQSGDILIILAGLSFATSTVLYKKYILHITPALLVALRTLICGVILSAILMIFEPNALAGVYEQPSVLIFIGSYTLFVIFIAYILFFWSLEHVKATTMALIGLLSPIIGIIYASILLNEQIYFQDVIGITIIMGGILLTKFHALKHSLATVRLKYKVRNTTH